MVQLSMVRLLHVVRGAVYGVVVSALCLLVTNDSFAQAAEQPVAALLSAHAQAKAERAELLAPVAYERAGAALQAYQKDLISQVKPERLQKRQAEAQQSADKLNQSLALTNKTLQTVIKAYDDAATAGAPTSQAEAWHKAAQRFAQAVAEVEDNDLDAARKKGAEAEVLLRDVELAAIKQGILGEARALIAKGNDANWAQTAPRSFALAQQQLNLAEQQLSRNRYEVDEPKKLAAQAAYEARHSQYLVDLIAAARNGDKTQVAENQWLTLENSLRDLLAEVNVPAQFDRGYFEALKQARENIIQQQQELIAARQDNTNLHDQLKEANATLKQLEQKLGGESEERLALQKTLITQQRLRDNVSKVEGMFTPQEARVYRQGRDLILSLSGIKFRSGKSTIEPDSFSLLAKLGEVLKLFPGASLTVEGHTDNQGSESANLLLSQDRADAVRQYLISNLNADAEKISSVGYGKSRPVATNDTETGRARNRRIDVVMQVDGL